MIFSAADFFLDMDSQVMPIWTERISGVELVMDRPQLFNNLGWWFYYYYFGGVCPPAREA